MSDAQSLTHRANALVDQIATDPTASRWLRRALADALLRDIVDAANDAEILATVLRERADLYTTAAATSVLYPVGARVRLLRDVERFPHFIADAGMTGTVTQSQDDLLAVRMDEHLAGAEEWDNEVVWSGDVGEELPTADIEAI